MLFSLLAPWGLAQPYPIETYSQTTLLKNWVLSVCIGKISHSEQDRRDAGITAGAYLEFGTVPIEAYEEATTLIDGYVSRTYHGSTEGNFDTMKCIDLYHSAELEQLVKKHVQE